MYRVSDAVRSIHGQDGAIVLDIRQGQMFNLNFVGSQIFELLKNESAQPMIVDEIVREFGVGRDRAEKEVQEFLETLMQMRLIEQFQPRETP